jgi:oxygen-independent coproporphyrinogen-3 oxidase
MEPYCDALKKELVLRRDYLAQEKVETIYFGGGTPSLIGAQNINSIIELIAKEYRLSSDAEITLEANPENLDSGTLAAFAKTPVNRLSIGVQSFFDDDLAYLGRIHSGSRAGDALVSALDHGFTNLSADLIFGIPTLTDERFIQNLERIAALGIPHLSAYALTIEPGTPLAKHIARGTRTPINEDQQVRQFKIMTEWAGHHGYIHYEISNLCKEGFESRHNSSYWKGDPYLGAGASAHSYNGNSRQWNAADITIYISSIEKGAPPFEIEMLTMDQKYNEYVMTSLRTIWGCDLLVIRNLFGQQYADHFSRGVEHRANDETLERKGSIIRLTEKGKLMADGIAGELFIARQ